MTILRQQAARKQPQIGVAVDGGFDCRFELMGRRGEGALGGFGTGVEGDREDLKELVPTHPNYRRSDSSVA